MKTLRMTNSHGQKDFLILLIELPFEFILLYKRAYIVLLTFVLSLNNEENLLSHFVTVYLLYLYGELLLIFLYLSWSLYNIISPWNLILCVHPDV